MVKRRSSPLGRWTFLLRFGRFARGLVYMAMGLLAARARLLSRGRAAGPEAALRAIVQSPYGRTIVALVAGGLFADALFRFLEAISRWRRSNFEWLSPAARALGAALLGWTALRVARSVRAERSGLVARRAILWVVGQSWGPRALMAAGCVAGLVALFEIMQGMTGRIRESFLRRSMGKRQRAWSDIVMRVGLATHGALVGVMAWYLVRAGVESNARDVADPGTALARIQHLPFGSGWLAALAVGLIAYGLSQWILGFYPRS